MIPTLIISGPVGVGKTSVGHEVSNKLVCLGAPHTFVDLDALSQTYPRSADDRFGSRLALGNLSSLWSNCLAAGSKNLIVARVIESWTELYDLEKAIPNSQVMLCQLQADEKTLIERVKRREIGSGYMRHQKRALELARSLALSAPAHFTVATDDRDLSSIANEILEHYEWQA